MDDARLAQLEKSITEIKDTQNKIFVALLGGLYKDSVGLLEESRQLRRDVNDLKTTVKSQATQIEEVVTFKRNVKIIVAGIAVVVPFVFELIKVTVGNLLNFFKGQ
jgi:outer membrane lipopolysaccharide assembly protein LptE/RlpB